VEVKKYPRLEINRYFLLVPYVGISLFRFHGSHVTAFKTQLLNVVSAFGKFPLALRQDKISIKEKSAKLNKRSHLLTQRFI